MKCMSLFSVQEHEMHKDSSRGDDVVPLGEQRDMAISWKTGSAFLPSQQKGVGV